MKPRSPRPREVTYASILYYKAVSNPAKIDTAMLKVAQGRSRKA